MTEPGAVVVLQYEREPDGDLVVRLGEVLVGWIERGREMTDLRSNWTEWRFVPCDPSEPAGPDRKNLLDAREDARRYHQRKEQ